MAVIKKTDNTKFGENIEKLEPSGIAGKNAKWYIQNVKWYIQSLWKNNLTVS